MKENIKNLMDSIPHGHKHKAIKLISEATGVSFNSIKSHWLSDGSDWSVPEKHQEATVTVLQNFHKQKVWEIEVESEEVVE